MESLPPPHKLVVPLVGLTLDEDLPNLEPDAAHLDLVLRFKSDIMALVGLALLVDALLVVLDHKHHGLLHVGMMELWITSIMVVLVHILIQLDTLYLELGTLMFEIHQKLMVTILLLGVFIAFDQVNSVLLGDELG